MSPDVKRLGKTMMHHDGLINPRLDVTRGGRLFECAFRQLVIVDFVALFALCADCILWTVMTKVEGRVGAQFRN